MNEEQKESGLLTDNPDMETAKKKEYQDYIKEVTPTHNLFLGG